MTKENKNIQMRHAGFIPASMDVATSAAWRSRQSGFTLVELAIVLTIIGLLIGGILKGQQLLQNSRVTATVAQIKGYEAATTSFRDAYGALPGDLKKAETRIPDCTYAACSTDTASKRGDGAIGDPAWLMIARQNENTGATAASETILFWFELLKAGLISGVTEAGVASGIYTYGKGLPAARMGGGFWVGNNDGTCTAAGDCSANGRPVALKKYTLLGTILVTVDLPTVDLTPTTSNTMAMLPSTAAQIDRKVDDGMPETGSVQAFGVEASCYGAAAAPYFYNESIDKKDCGVYIRIQQ